MIHYIIVCVIALLMSSCGSQKKNVALSRATLSDEGMELRAVSSRAQSKSRNRIDETDQLSAQCSDVAVPLNAKQVLYSSESHERVGIELAFEVASTIETIQAFYVRNMEAFGWRNLAAARNAELTLFFDKPQHICSVSLRPVAKHTDKIIIVIAINEKGQEFHAE